MVLAGDDMDDVLGGSSYLRAVYTVRAMREEPYQRVFIVGGGPSAVPVSEKIRVFLAGSGLSVEKVSLETKSISTRANIDSVAPMLRAELEKNPKARIVVLTSDYHIYRTLRLFRKAGFWPSTSPVPDAIKRASFVEQRWPAFLDLCRETVKIAYYRWKGWI